MDLVHQYTDIHQGAESCILSYVKMYCANIFNDLYVTTTSYNKYLLNNDQEQSEFKETHRKAPTK